MKRDARSLAAGHIWPSRSHDHSRTRQARAGRRSAGAEQRRVAGGSDYFIFKSAMSLRRQNAADTSRRAISNMTYRDHKRPPGDIAARRLLQRTPLQPKAGQQRREALPTALRVSRRHRRWLFMAREGGLTPPQTYRFRSPHISDRGPWKIASPSKRVRIADFINIKAALAIFCPFAMSRKPSRPASFRGFLWLS